MLRIPEGSCFAQQTTLIFDKSRSPAHYPLSGRADSPCSLREQGGVLLALLPEGVLTPPIFDRRSPDIFDISLIPSFPCPCFARARDVRRPAGIASRLGRAHASLPRPRPSGRAAKLGRDSAHP